jgi:vitamin B12 transporter
MTVAVVGTASAQSPARPAGDSLHPRDTLAAAVITATRVPVSTVAPTATTTVLRGSELRAQGLTRVADALRLVPGADVVASGAVGSQTSLFLRGGNSNYVRVLVDGVPVNDAGGSIDLANLALDNVDRIEVVRGPASVLYGSDAVTGVVQIFTDDGTGPTALRAAIAGGTRGSLRASAGATGGAASARYSVGVSREATAGILPFNNEYRNDVLSGALRLTPDARTDARISARWSAGAYHYPTDYSGAVVDHNAEQVDHRFTASVDAGRRLRDGVELRATLTSNEYLPRTNDAPDNAADTLGFYGYFSRSVRTRRAADVRVNVRASARATVTLGAEASRDRERTTSRSLSQYGNSSDAFEASRHIGGLYAQAIGDATDRLSYVVGLRRDDNSAFGVFTTARAALAWLAGPGARVRVAAGNAFRAPSFFENFATGFVRGNPALRPEESRSAELGADLTVANGALQLAFTGYAQRFRNIVQYTGTAPAPGAPNYYNVAAADANGLELEATWRPASRLTGTLAYALTDTRVTASGFDTTAGASYVRGEPLIRRPRHTLGASLSRTFGDGGSVRVRALRVGERGDRDYARYPVAAVTLPAYVKVDVSAVVPTAARGVALTFRADNVFDARYEEITGFRAPGVTVLAGLSYHP